MALDEIEDLLSENRDFLRDVTSIQVTGGEPYLREDLPELIQAIRGHLPRTTIWIPTNGLTPRRIEATTREMLHDADGIRLGVSVSIDGIPGTHDTIRGIEGSFDRAIETLKRLSTLKEAHAGLSVSVGMTVTNENHEELPKVWSLAGTHGADFSFRPVNFSDLYYRNRGTPPTPSDCAERLLPTLQSMGKALIENKGLRHAITNLRYMQDALDHIRDPNRRRLPCRATTASFFLDPYGNVYPCLFIGDALGNVKDEPLSKILRSKAAGVARTRISRGDCPGCWVECEVYREIIRDQMGLLGTALKAVLRPGTAGIS
jgi:MoaA/NifB/PqqE/SkfB family radical SAM enzyme